MATACWAFIVAKRPLAKTAPLLDFGSLHGTNIEIHQQDIHKCLWTAGGYSSPSGIALADSGKSIGSKFINATTRINQVMSD
jgi:hypothetical protein